MAFNIPSESRKIIDNNQYITHWGLEDPEIRLIRTLLSGKGVRVAVLDSDCQLDHTDLKIPCSNYRDFVVESGRDPAENDEQRHGTFVTGIIGARGIAPGMRGVAPNCELFFGRIVDTHYSGISDETLEKGINWAVEDLQAQVINLSIKDTQCNPKIQGLIQNHIWDAANNNRALTFVCAAGNSIPIPGRSTIEFPAAYQSTLAIGSIYKNGSEAMGSRGNLLDFVAPGESVTSLLPNNTYGESDNLNSSFAAPFVSGLLALFLEDYHACFGSYPSPFKLRRALITTAKDINIQGFDGNSGYGKIGLMKLIIRNRLLKRGIEFKDAALDEIQTEINKLRNSFNDTTLFDRVVKENFTLIN